MQIETSELDSITILNEYLALTYQFRIQNDLSLPDNKQLAVKWQSQKYQFLASWRSKVTGA
jgi:hypothetical protein